LTYAGNHGLEILHPDGSRFVHPMPKEYEDKVSVLLKTLQDQVNIYSFTFELNIMNLKLNF
jgi:trehalose 6-phosphate synthase/phosphatase